MFTIDTHTHIIPKKIPNFSKQFGYGNIIHLEHQEDGKAWMMQGDKKFRLIEPNCWDVDLRLQEMGQHQIDVQVICTIPVMFNYQIKAEDGLIVSQFLNDDIYQTLLQHPKKFIGLGTLPMQNVSMAVKELERIMSLGFNGVQIGSNVNQINLSDKQFDPFWKVAEDLKAAILIHPWDMFGQEHITQYWLPWLVGMPAEISRAIAHMIFGGVFERFPNLKVCFAHGGGSFLPTISRLEHGFNCRPDLVALDNPINPKNYLGKFWVDSHVNDHKMLQYIIDLIGADKVMQGSDYPFPLGESVPGDLIRTAPFTKEIKEKLMSTAAISWLGLE